MQGSFRTFSGAPTSADLSGRQGYGELVGHFLKGRTARKKDMMQGAFGLPASAGPDTITLTGLKANGVASREIHPAYRMANLSPTAIPAISRWEIPTLRDAYARAIEVFWLSDALVAHEEGAVRMADGRWIVDLYPAVASRAVKALPRLKTMAKNDARRLEGTTVLLASPDARNYYHWLHQILPQIDAIRSAVSDSEIDRWLARDLRPFAQEILAHLGVDLSKVEMVGDRPVQCDRLIVATIPPMGALNYAGEWPRRRIRGLFLPDESVRPGRRLYLRRDEGDRRAIVNQAEVEAFLRSKGFESRSMSGLSIAEQARLAAESAVIVAPHGAALANLVFCSPGTQVVELLPRLWPSPLYGMIAQSCDLRHLFVLGVEPSIPALRIRQSSAATEVSLPRLTQALRRLESIS